MLTPFEPAYVPTHKGKLRLRSDDAKTWQNNRYQVTAEPVVSTDPALPSLLYLTIKRRDKKPIRSWRDLLWIKNQLAGDECEAIEVFPAMSRLVDTSNQYHLWVLPPDYRLAVGFEESAICDGDGTTEPGMPRQQPLPLWYPKPTHSAEDIERLTQDG